MATSMTPEHTPFCLRLEWHTPLQILTDHHHLYLDLCQDLGPFRGQTRQEA